MSRATVIGILMGVIGVAGLAACKDDYTGAGGSGTAGEPQEPGAIAVRVSCAGPGCGQAGALIASVDRTCATLGTGQEFSVSATIATNAVITAGQPVTAELGGLPHGILCVKALLDVDRSGFASSGDVVSSQPPVAVDVPAGGSVTANVVLDTVAGAGGGGGGGAASVSLAVSCSGNGCGHPGILHGEVKQCGFGGSVVASKTLSGQNLTAGFPVDLAIGGVAAGDWCATAWLDVNANGVRDSGDAIPGAFEVPVGVFGGAVGAAITLDQTQHL